MTRLQAAEQLLSEMNRAEKAQVLQWVVRDLGEAFPGIENVPIPEDPLTALRGSGHGERLVDRLLQNRREDRERELDLAREEGKSLNEVTLEALSVGEGLAGQPIKRRDLSDIAGSWVADPTTDEILQEQRRIDPELRR